jgi:hypothetical protein
MTTENATGAATSQLESGQAKCRCSFCDADQNQVRQLIGGPHGIFICDGCVLLCVDIIETVAEDSGRAAFRHCLVPADEPRYYDLKEQSDEQRKLLEAAEPLIPAQFAALRESIAGLLRPQPETRGPKPKKTPRAR